MAIEEREHGVEGEPLDAIGRWATSGVESGMELAEATEAGVDTPGHGAVIVEGDQMVLNLGPQHPSTHGVLRVLLELEGEVAKKVIPDLGYLHRGIEKIGEYRMYNQFVPWTDRTDYVAAFTGNYAFVKTVE